jgi:DNA-binding transcriptional LysR family regulator
LNIETIGAFVYAYQLGSINKAADALYLTQPSVTARIKSLERDLDTQLFNRDGNQITLTEKGKEFLPHAQHILETYEKIKLSLRQKQTFHENLTIGCSFTVSTYILPAIIPSLRVKFPLVRIQVMTGHSQDILHKVLNEEVDFGILRTVSHPKIEIYQSIHDPISLIVPPGHPLINASDKLSINKVSSEPLIFFDHGSIDWLMIHGLFKKSISPPNVIMEVDNIEAAKKLVLKGIGISFLPDICIQDELANGTLYKINLTPPTQLSRKIDIICLSGSHPRFIDFFAEAFQNFSKKLSLLPS